MSFYSIDAVLNKKNAGWCVAILLCSYFFIISILAGPAPQIIFGHDVIAILDGAYKMHWGQYQSTDWYSPLGVLAYAPTWVMSYFTTSYVEAYHLSQLALAILLLPLIFWVCKRNLTGILGPVALLYLFTLIITPRVCHFSSEMLSFSCGYNRLGGALMMISMVILFGHEQANERNLKINSLILGIITSSLILLKISFGLIEIITTIYILLLKKEFKFLLYFFVSLIATTIVLSITLQLNIMSYFGDILCAFHAKKEAGATSLPIVIQSALLSTIVLFVIFLLAIKKSFGIQKTLLFLPLVFLPLGIALGNSPLSPIPNDYFETPVSAFLLVQMLGFEHKVQQFNTRYSIACCLCLLLIFPIFLRNLASIQINHDLNTSTYKTTSVPVIGDGPLRGLAVLGFGGEPPLTSNYFGKVQDGVVLLEKNKLGQSSCLVFDFTNPINICRGVRPPIGSPTFWQKGFSFSDSSMPSEKSVFAGAECILLPKHFGDGDNSSVSLIFNSYQKQIQDHYKYLDESNEWILFKKLESDKPSNH
jgi:hypothetical protein